MVDHFARKQDEVDMEQVEHLLQADQHVEASAELALEIDSVRQALRELTVEQ